MTWIALAASVVAGPVVTATAGGARGEANPVVQGPITGGTHGFAWDHWPWKLPNGYTEKEYFISGTAKAYGVQSPPAAYKTRILMYLPPKRAFNGTLVSEWFNVTSNYDVPFDFVWSHTALLARGYAVELVSAQEVGVCANKNPAGSPEVCTPTSLKGWDGARYGSLHHPGDDYSFDIFSQAVQAARHPRGISPMGSLKVRRVIAAGQSQSAQRFDQYMVNGADAHARVIDALLDDSPVGDPPIAKPRVPTISLWSEDSFLPVATTSHNQRVWMVAGASHGDAYMSAFSTTVTGNNLGTPPSSDYATTLNTARNYGQEGLA
ncbi:MAG TPA: alpha/beta hydrolase domain-containing protein, partial [Gemmatimonadales bacterium]